jgi:hypothetical protein
MKLDRSSLTLSIALACSACSSTWHSARFVPSPLEVAVPAPGEPYAEARALISVRGIRKAVKSTGQAAQVEINLRLDNVGHTALALDGEGFDLVTSDLVSFAAPLIEPAPGATIAPGEKLNYVLQFPTPPDHSADDLDWSGLNLRFKVRFEERAVITGVTFERLIVPAYYYDPYWGPYPYGGYPGYPYSHVGISVSGTVGN